MRNHQVRRYHADFEELHNRLCAELIIMPCFPEGGGVASLVGTCSSRSKFFVLVRYSTGNPPVVLPNDFVFSATM